MALADSGLQPGQSDDPYDVRLATRAGGVLRTFNEAGVLTAADVHVATRLGRLGGEADERVLLAAALAVRGLRQGSVCIDLTAIGDTVLSEWDEPVDVSALAWPEPEAWHAACAASSLVATGGDAQPGHPLRLDHGLLYLDRYWRQEQQVRRELAGRAAAAPPVVDTDRLRAGLGRLFPGDAPDAQRLAAAVAALRRVTVLAGGPGTGKTTTVARLLALLADQPGPAPRIALAAPTGKAAARLQQAVAEAPLPDDDRQRLGALRASTLHRLLGPRPDTRSRFRHHAGNRLPYDVIVVDETSMVSLTLMARLLEAVRPATRVVLVGDPDQLASVEAGAVLGDLARAPGPAEPELSARLGELVPGDLDGSPVVNGVVTLHRTYRFRGTVAELARAIQASDADAAVDLLRSGAEDVRFVETDLEQARPASLEGLQADVLATGTALATAAEAGDAQRALHALGEHQLLCAHRRGPYGVARWAAEAARWLEHEPGAAGGDTEWYPGQPLLITANDYELGLYNGDTGVVIRTADGLRAAFTPDRDPIAPVRLSAVQTVHAMTIHRSQGSQYDRVSVLLPPAESPLLTRELLYTAVTRAQSRVRVIGTESAVRAAVTQPIARASGLRQHALQVS